MISMNIKGSLWEDFLSKKREKVGKKNGNEWEVSAR